MLFLLSLGAVVLKKRKLFLKGDVMRKLSCKRAVDITIFIFVILPVWGIFIQVIDKKAFVVSELLEEIHLATSLTTIVWLIYGIACLFAEPLRKVSEEEPWKPSEDFHNMIHKDQGKGSVLCKGCGKPLPQAQIDFGLGNPKYSEWHREGFCSLLCFEQHCDGMANDN